MDYINLKVNTPSPNKKTNGNSRFLWLVFVLLVGVAILNVSKVKSALAGMLGPVDFSSGVPIIGSGSIKETDGRTNILLLGMDTRESNSVGGGRPDTLMVLSINSDNNDVVIISLPRDLWVVGSRGDHAKVNELYNYYGGGKEGADETVDAVGKVLGIPIHYYSVVNFAMFKDLIDTLGGVEVNVENSFTDREYPLEGKESAPENERYETITFTKGTMVMNGEVALKYARSRHGDNGEGTDFARAKRQQNLLLAVKNKLLSSQTLTDITKIKSMYGIYAKNVETNVDFSTLELLFNLYRKKTFSDIKTLVLDDRSSTSDGGLLYSPTDLTLYGGKYVLIPMAGAEDYSQIHAYIQKFLFD